MGLGWRMSVDDLAERALLRGGGMEGQNLANGLAHLVVGGEADAGAFAHAAALELEAEFEKEELFEDEAPVRGCGRALQLRERCAFGRKMNFAQRGFATGQVEAGKHRLRQALGHVAAHASQAD